MIPVATESLMRLCFKLLRLSSCDERVANGRLQHVGTDNHDPLCIKLMQPNMFRCSSRCLHIFVGCLKILTKCRPYNFLKSFFKVSFLTCLTTVPENHQHLVFFMNNFRDFVIFFKVMAFGSL